MNGADMDSPSLALKLLSFMVGLLLWAVALTFWAFAAPVLGHVYLGWK
jgi:hypothetical protein